MLSYYSFARKSIKWWKKLCFHLFDLVMVNAHILDKKLSKKKMSLEMFYERVAEGFIASARTNIREQGQTSSLAGRLVRTDHFSYRIPATHGRINQRTCRICARKSKHKTGKTVKKCTKTYCRKCDVGLCIGQCFEVYHSKLNYWE
jgi:hypothetical protein